MAEILQKFDSSESVTHSPRNEFEVEPQIPTTRASVQVQLNISTPDPHTPDSTSLHYFDPSAEPQKFDQSEFVLHSPRKKIEAELQISVTPTSVLANFGASMFHSHTPDGRFYYPLPLQQIFRIHQVLVQWQATQRFALL